MEGRPVTAENAAAIAATLGDARREGRAWRCKCPLHGGRSLVICDGDDGRVVAGGTLVRENEKYNPNVSVNVRLQP
jgi:hypothetical protein